MTDLAETLRSLNLLVCPCCDGTAMLPSGRSCPNCGGLGMPGIATGIGFPRRDGTGVCTHEWDKPIVLGPTYRKVSCKHCSFGYEDDSSD